LEAIKRLQARGEPISNDTIWEKSIALGTIAELERLVHEDDARKRWSMSKTPQEELDAFLADRERMVESGTVSPFDRLELMALEIFTQWRERQSENKTQ